MLQMHVNGCSVVKSYRTSIDGKRPNFSSIVSTLGVRLPLVVGRVHIFIFRLGTTKR